MFAHQSAGVFTVHSAFFLSNNLRLMTDAPAKTPLRMTASEFVTCMAVMAGAAKVGPRKPKRHRYASVKREPIADKFRWIESKEGERTKFPVYAITLTKIPRGKQYPYSSKSR